MLKQVIVIRTDLKMGKGKLATQVAHASVTAFYKTLENNRSLGIKWIEEGQKKIVLKVSSEEELNNIYERAIKEGLIAVKIYDAGLTQLRPGTFTAIGIGPDDEDRIDRVTRDLKLL